MVTYASGRTWIEHLGYVRDVLETLRKVSLTAKLQKCVWGAKTVEYLGHEVGSGMVKVPELRVKAAIADFWRPITKTDLKAFFSRIRGLLPTVYTRLWSRGSAS